MIEDAVRRAVRLQAAISEMTQELDELKAELRVEVGIGKSAEVAGITVRIVENRRFDAALAEKVIPAATLDFVSRRTVDRVLCAERLSTELYAACQKESTPRVVFE